MSRTGAIGILLLSAFALAGCGGGSSLVNKIHGTRLTIFESVPLDGAAEPNGQAVVNGAQLALNQIGGRIGRYRIRIRVLDDATATAGGWDPGQTEADARIAAADRTTIGYIGDLESGASAVSIPLLNHEGIAQVSPTSTAVGLTSDAPGSSPGEPEKYYPTGVRTFARVVPNDLVRRRRPGRSRAAARLHADVPGGGRGGRRDRLRDHVPGGRQVGGPERRRHAVLRGRRLQLHRVRRERRRREA